MTNQTVLTHDELKEAVLDYVWNKKGRVRTPDDVWFEKHEPHVLQQYGSSPTFTAIVTWGNE